MIHFIFSLIWGYFASCIQALEHKTLPSLSNTISAYYSSLERFRENKSLSILIDTCTPPEDDLSYLIERNNALLSLPQKLFYHGYDIARVINAQRARTLIRQKRYKHIYVPQHYLFWTEGAWHVFAERIQTHNTKVQLTVEHMNEIEDFVINTNHTDFGHVNMFNTESNSGIPTTVFYDMEKQTFKSGDMTNDKNYAGLLGFLAITLQNCSDINQQEATTLQALDTLKTHVERATNYIETRKGQKPPTLISLNDRSDLDPHGFDSTDVI